MSVVLQLVSARQNNDNQSKQARFENMVFLLRIAVNLFCRGVGLSLVKCDEWYILLLLLSCFLS